METNKKREKGRMSRKRIGALIKFGRENSSQPKVWITFLFDELSRLTTGNGDIKSIADKNIYKSLRLLLHCTGLPNRKAHFRS